MNLDNYEPYMRKRIIAIATEIVMSQVERGEVALDDAAIKAAMPEAFRTARDAVVAAWEFVS